MPNPNVRIKIRGSPVGLFPGRMKNGGHGGIFPGKGDRRTRRPHRRLGRPRPPLLRPPAKWWDRCLATTLTERRKSREAGLCTVARQHRGRCERLLSGARAHARTQLLCSPHGWRETFQPPALFALLLSPHILHVLHTAPRELGNLDFSITEGDSKCFNTLKAMLPAVRKFAAGLTKKKRGAAAGAGGAGDDAGD
ncbi:hypothetical protein FA15DRAFT_657956 [Coprinopsis marcescibilis]|uniref:Uncharacterized protein n=1 Tax=Coprinopsis marcescibilis TaxID=230819 RepID=A0A5C3KN52_COPMA|nr:hypothetical protein FA15DRAFT_657956 [Coprinopsis marcescibilis]